MTGPTEPQALWLLANRYFVGKVVGRGGYGMVCRGLDRTTGQAVALKMLSPEAGRDRDAVERMLREQQALVALSGTCAVTAVDLCRLESGAPCLVMQWLEGQDLEQQLSAWEAAGERGSPQQLLEVLAPLTDTLDRAHAIGIVHRDIKPANIFLSTSPPGTRLLDFGLARFRSSAPLTAAGMVMGSPSYIAPEAWRGNSAEIDGRADLYSLGVIVFRWLTGKLPFDAPDLVGKMLAVTSGPRPSATALNPQLPPEVDAWVARALAIDPNERFQSGQALLAALGAALSGRAASPRAASERPRALADAQEALASAFRAAAGLLKRFSAKTDPPPPAQPPAATPATSTLWLDSSELEPAQPQTAPRQNTVWLDSSELQETAPRQNTVWLPSTELQEAAPRQNTVWLDSSELSEVPKADAVAPAPAVTEPKRVTAKKKKKKKSKRKSRRKKSR